MTDKEVIERLTKLIKSRERFQLESDVSSEFVCNTEALRFARYFIKAFRFARYYIKAFGFARYFIKERDVVSDAKWFINALRESDVRDLKEVLPEDVHDGLKDLTESVTYLERLENLVYQTEKPTTNL